MSNSHSSSTDTRACLPSRLARRLPWLLCAVASGLLVYVSFPPADLWPLAYVVMVPLLVACVHSTSGKEAAAYGALCGAAAYLPGLAWVASVTVAGWVILALYLSLYLAVWSAVAWWLQRRRRLLWPLWAACAWVGLEFVRAKLGPGFPWLLTGYTQYKVLPLIQIAAVTGVYGVSFLVMFVGSSVAQVVVRLGVRRAPPPSVRHVLCACAAVAVLAASLLGGKVAVGTIDVRQGPTVAVVQQNLPRYVRDLVAASEGDFYAKARDEIKLAADLSRQAVDRDTSLLVWPETTIQAPMNVAPELLAGKEIRDVHLLALEELKRIGKSCGCHFLVGCPVWFSPSAGYMRTVPAAGQVESVGNGGVLLSPEGSFVGRYDKMHLVPFGEYVPLADWFPFLYALTPFKRGLTPGEKAVVFELPSRGARAGARFGVLICYEDVVPSLVRRFRLGGAQFLVNLTDEGWYHIPGELTQHLAMAVFRAVETRSTLVRAANTGISCFIGPRGEIYRIVGQDVNGRFQVRNVAGTTRGAVRLTDIKTFYIRFGDVFAATCALVSLVVLAGPLAARAFLRRRSGAPEGSARAAADAPEDA